MTGGTRRAIWWFKAVNSVLFTVLGMTIFVRVALVAGPSLTAIPGLVLGLAMFALGTYRIVAMVTRVQ